MKIKTIFIGRRPARETPRNQGGGRAKRLSCQELIEAGGGGMSRTLKFGGLAAHAGQVHGSDKAIEAKDV
jgi:hypothetical protein